MKDVTDPFWRRFPVADAQGRAQPGTESLSDQLYAGRNYFGYKSCMQALFWMLHFEAWGNLSRQDLAQMDEAEILRYVAEIIDFQGQALVNVCSARLLVSQYCAGLKLATHATAAQKALHKA